MNMNSEIGTKSDCSGRIVKRSIERIIKRIIERLIERIDRSLFNDDAPIPLPLAGRKLQVNSDWGRETR